MKLVQAFIEKKKTEPNFILAAEKERDMFLAECEKVSIQAKKIQLTIWQNQFKYNWANKEYEIREYYLKVW